MGEKRGEERETRWHLDLRHMPLDLKERIEEQAILKRRSVPNEVIVLLEAAMNGKTS